MLIFSSSSSLPGGGLNVLKTRHRSPKVGESGPSQLLLSVVLAQQQQQQQKNENNNQVRELSSPVCLVSFPTRSHCAFSTYSSEGLALSRWAEWLIFIPPRRPTWPPPPPSSSFFFFFLQLCSLLLLLLELQGRPLNEMQQLLEAETRKKLKL